MNLDYLKGKTIVSAAISVYGEGSADERYNELMLEFADSTGVKISYWADYADDASLEVTYESE